MAGKAAAPEEPQEAAEELPPAPRVEAVPLEPLGWVTRRDAGSGAVVAMREDGYLKIDYPGGERVVELPDGSRMTFGRDWGGMRWLRYLHLCSLLVFCSYRDVSVFH